MYRYWIIIFGVVLCSICSSAQNNWSYIDLIEQLTDLERLALLPDKWERCAQWSSYDRASRYDEVTDQYVNWSSNRDNLGLLNIKDDKFYYADINGPGVIWRMWSPCGREGQVKIYIDDDKIPAIDLAITGYFNGENEPFTRSALVHESAQGYNCYIPIPFQKSCRIVADRIWYGGPGRFYHFTYTTYPVGTILPTFQRDFTYEESYALDMANFRLSYPGDDPAGQRQGEITYQKSVTIRPCETVTIVKLIGERAITALKVHMDLPEPPEEYDVLRELAISIFWDEEFQSSVWSPLGDFFGAAPGVNLYKSLPMGMTEEGFYSYWYMPFKKSALIQLTNDGDMDRTVTFTITHAPLTRPVHEFGRFHAKWHRDALLPSDPGRSIDWTLLKTEGIGRYCGVMLHVWNPNEGWWGEGDEKFFVDVEKFPSIFGTSTEDYFGFAFGTPKTFSNCYHNQTVNKANFGHISMNRWHITDNVPFQESIEGSIGKFYSNSVPTIYAATVYWYQAPGGIDHYSSVPLEERLGYWYPITIPLIEYDPVEIDFPDEEIEPEEVLVSVGEFTKIYDPRVGENQTKLINDHCFMRDSDGTWHFWGITNGPHFAYATASSLTQQPWDKQPFALTAVWDPWKEVILWAPHVIFNEGRYYMFYCAGSTDDTRYKLHLATSDDLKTWTRHQQNPMIIDGFHARDPFILKIGEIWVMYYTATSRPSGGHHIVACKTSDDLIHWSGRRVVFRDPSKGKRGGPCESPFVVRRGEYYYLFIGPREEYVGTDVFRSKNPFEWSITDKVGHIQSHAAEVVRDMDGKWYISHCGVDQYGLYLAPLNWNDSLDGASSSLPILRINAPLESDTLTSGSIYPIIWESHSSIQKVNLDCSLNSGTSWINMSTSFTDTNMYEWFVPNTASGSCLIRISDTNDSSICDISEEFVIQLSTGQSRDFNDDIPNKFNLSQNYPNPFNTATTIRYALPSASHVTIKVFDLMGRELEILVDETGQPSHHKVEWRAGNLTSGIYLYRLRAGDYVETKKLILQK